MKRFFAIRVVVVFGAWALFLGYLPQSASVNAQEMSNIDKVEKALKMSIRLYGAIYSYSAIIKIRERINGKMMEEEHIKTVFLKPRRIYLEWLKPYQGMRSSYVPERDGRDNFQIEGYGISGAFGIFSWTNDSVLIDKIYPHRFRPYQTNLSYLFDLAMKTWNAAKKLGTIRVNELSPVDDPLMGGKAIKADVFFSDDPNQGVAFGRVVFYFDKNTGLPLHFEIYEHNGDLWGHYVFTEFKPNIDIDARIFDLHNKP
jgi:Protein of unknown function (DUF1571)